MIRAGVGQSQQQATGQAVEEAARQALARAGISRADLAIMFFTADHAGHADDEIRDVLAFIKTFDNTEFSTIYCEREWRATKSLNFDYSDVAMLVIPRRVGTEEYFGEFVAKAQDNKSLMILLPDSYNGNPQALLQSMADKAGFHSVIGAGSTENGEAGATFQLCGDKVASNSVAGAYLSGEFDVHVDITQGCQPISEPMLITKAEGNLIYEINGRPAIEAFARLLKGPLAEDIRRQCELEPQGEPSSQAQPDLDLAVLRHIAAQEQRQCARDRL